MAKIILKTGNLDDFIAYILEQIGQPYLWGGQHTRLTPDNYVSVIDKKESDASNRAAAKAFCEKAFAGGATVLYAYDCSGLGVYFLLNLEHVIAKDLSANSLMGICDIVPEAKRGYWVFRFTDGTNRARHIGYMVSDTEVVHAAGRSSGVIKEKYRASKWDAVGKPKCFDFAAPTPEPAPEPPKPSTHQYVCVKGKIKSNGKPEKSVNVRSGNGSKYPSLGTVHSTDLLPLIAQADDDPYWYKVLYTHKKGKETITEDAYITSNTKYTEVVYKL